MMTRTSVTSFSLLLFMHLYPMEIIKWPGKWNRERFIQRMEGDETEREDIVNAGGERSARNV